jgi:hypothetical protein
LHAKLGVPAEELIQIRYDATMFIARSESAFRWSLKPSPTPSGCLISIVTSDNYSGNFSYDEQSGGIA